MLGHYCSQTHTHWQQQTFFCIHSSNKCQAYSMVQWSHSKIFTLTTKLHKFSITGVTAAVCDMNGGFKSLHVSEIMILLLAKNTEARCCIGPKSHVDCISPREKGDRVLNLTTICRFSLAVRASRMSEGDGVGDCPSSGTLCNVLCLFDNQTTQSAWASFCSVVFFRNLCIISQNQLLQSNYVVCWPISSFFSLFMVQYHNHMTPMIFPFPKIAH